MVYGGADEKGFCIEIPSIDHGYWEELVREMLKELA